MNRHFRPFAIGTLAIAGLGLVGSAFVPRVDADQWDKKTIVTVKEPIIAGNKVLDPGTYVWRLLDNTGGDRHIVQIFDKDQQHLETTILAIPNYRLEPTGHTQFAFWETPAGVPKAVRAWFYPGDNFGQEFVFPKKLVAQLASAAPVPLPVHYNESAQPQPEAQPVPAPEPAPVAAPAPEPQAQTSTPAPQAAPAALPHTATFNPLVGLLGFLSLSLAGVLSLATRKIADIKA